jgi:hypothetical protein
MRYVCYILITLLHEQTHVELHSRGGVVWPLHIDPTLADSPWFQAMTERTKEAG